MAASKATRLEIGQALDVGIKRRGAPNQDAIGVLLPTLLGKHAPLLVVADGMGGQQEGARAAQIVIDEITKAYKKANRKAESTQTLAAGIRLAHKRIQQYVEKHKDVASMGAAVVAAVIGGQQITIANVGDARIYLIHEEAIRQVSYDHSFVAEQVRQGMITQAEALTHPRRNVLTMSVTSKREALEPYTASIPYAAGDTLLLCSDGLWGTVSEAQLQAVVMELPPQQAADKLVKMANMNQGPDNISVVIARLG